MNEKYTRAPLYVDAYDLCQWVLEVFGSDVGILSQTLCKNSLELVEAIALAIVDRNREENLEIADERLISLRTQLRLANALGDLTDKQMLDALEQADTIGNQLGGWIRKLGPV